MLCTVYYFCTTPVNYSASKINTTLLQIQHHLINIQVIRTTLITDRKLTEHNTLELTIVSTLHRLSKKAEPRSARSNTYLFCHALGYTMTYVL